MHDRSVARLEGAQRLILDEPFDGIGSACDKHSLLTHEFASNGVSGLEFNPNFPAEVSLEVLIVHDSFCPA